MTNIHDTNIRVVIMSSVGYTHRSLFSEDKTKVTCPLGFD